MRHEVRARFVSACEATHLTKRRLVVDNRVPDHHFCTKLLELMLHSAAMLLHQVKQQVTSLTFDFHLRCFRSILHG